ncbi:hypothetical protein F5J12DRAFT_818187, partial [Pisolithus orientalis]|uniref:uncharacterized protein n=1 Tax=Pisolithus orientalis TaxID=936130 RepID=UPI00222513BE
PHSSSSPPTSILDLAGQSTHVVYVRRRNTREQTEALQKVYAMTAHPSRGQRQSLADELGIPLQTGSRTNVRRPEKNRLHTKKIYHQSIRTDRLSWDSDHISRKAASKSSVSRSTISLDEIAELSERSTRLRQSAEVSTPRRSADLWKYMPSSPLTPHSPPTREETDTSSEAKVFHSLEWACLRARKEIRADDDEPWKGPESEAGTVSDNLNLLHKRDATSVHTAGSDCVTHSKDVEAAITLLAIKTRS